MPVVVAGCALIFPFALMLAFCLITGTPCPVDGFDEAAYESPAVTFRYTVTSLVVAGVMLVIFIFGVLYIRRKWKKPVLATIMTIVFVFFVAMLWGIADSGTSADRQILIFASIEFLVAGLIVFIPFVSLVYFPATFLVFGTALDLSGQFSDFAGHDLMYLAFLDVVVCWVVYGIFLRATEREITAEKMSQRDELTGARNRHCLREDFPTYFGSTIRIMLCDIDNFKYYNDNFDHTVGDDLLKQFYFALRDAFGERSVYRYGGDEFLVVLVDVGYDDFVDGAKKVDEALARIQLNGANANLTYSGGCVSGIAEDNIMFRDMLHAADENLLKAKREGKNRIVG